MKHKMITLMLILCLILPTCNIVWADTTSVNEETLNSAATSSQTPLVSENEVAAAVQNVQVEEQVEDETPAMQFPHTVTVYFYYRNSQGQFVSQKASNTFKSEGDGWSKAVSYFERQIKNNNLTTVNAGLTTYTFTGQWVGDNGETLTSNDRVSVKGNTYGKDTTLNFYAQYTETQKHKIDFYAIDNIGHTSGSASNLGVITSYTHIFKTPTDVPAGYEFLYWKNLETEDIKNPGEQLTVDATQLTEDAEIIYYAVYQYQPSIRVIYNYLDGIKDTGAQRTPINIIENAPNNLYWFYENSNQPINNDETIQLPNKITTIEKLNIEETTNVYAHYFTISWVNENGNLLEEDTNIPYGAQPEYNGEEPIKESDPQYSYHFIGWDSELTTVTENKTYTAIYESTINSYTVTYAPGLFGTFKPVSFTLEYGSETPIFKGTTGLKGYQFDGWDKEIQNIITEDIEYTALWKEVPADIPVEPITPEVVPVEPIDPPVIDEPTTPEPPAVSEKNTPIVRIQTQIVPIRATPVVIEEPIVEEEEEVVENITPTAVAENIPIGSWALVNLISMLLTILFSIILLVSLIINKIKQRNNDEEKINNKVIIRIVTIIIALIALIIFIFTEDMSLPMVLIDKWTIVMILITIVQAILMGASKHKVEENDEAVSEDQL